ncbi:MAG: carbon storage regulator [Gemmataceae bacterium]|jgi:carbon storage regulator|nr:carbon storage regulator [Gemmataceae bacterium]
MLVLSRKPGEEIIIGNNVRITIVSVKGDRIRLGIDAPREVSIQRAELLTPVASTVVGPDHEIEIDLGGNHNPSIADTIRH